MAPLGNDGLDCINGVNNESTAHVAEVTTASFASADSLRAKRSPCKGARARYRKLVQVMASKIEADPAMFDMDVMELNLPALVTKNPWLHQKFMKRMENLKQMSLAERQHPMYVPTMVGFQSTSEEQPPLGFFEPIKVVVGNQDCEQRRLVIENDAPAKTVMAPKVEDIGLPMKILSHTPTITRFEA